MKILIAIPTFEHVQNEVFQAVWDLDKCGHSVDLKIVTGHDCAQARTKIAEIAIDSGYDYVLYVDSDTVIPRDTLKYLLDPAADIVMGCCPRKNTEKQDYPLCPVSCPDLSKALTFNELQGSSRIELKVGGFACALVKTSVFSKISYPYFRYVVYENKKALSEDFYFCLEAKRENIKIWADPRVKCGHLARYYQYK